MNQDEKRWIVLLVAVIIIAVVFFVVLGIEKNNQENVAEVPQNDQQNEEQYTVELDDGTKLNTSESFNSNKTFGDFEVSNIQYTTRPDGMTVLLADVTNKGDTRYDVQEITIKILDTQTNIDVNITNENNSYGYFTQYMNYNGIIFKIVERSSL